MELIAVEAGSGKREADEALLFRGERRFDVNRYRDRSPMQSHHRFVAKDRREIDSERLDVRDLLGSHIDAQDLKAFAGIRLVKHVRRAAEDESPRRALARNEPKRVLARTQRFSFDDDVVVEYHSRRGI